MSDLDIWDVTFRHMGCLVWRVLSQISGSFAPTLGRVVLFIFSRSSQVLESFCPNSGRVLPLHWEVFFETTRGGHQHVWGQFPKPQGMVSILKMNIRGLDNGLSDYPRAG